MGNCELLCDQFESDKNQILISKHKKIKTKGLGQTKPNETKHKPEHIVDDSSKDLINNNMNNSTMSPKEKEETLKGGPTSLYTPSTLNNSRRELFQKRDMRYAQYEKEAYRVIRLQRAYKRRLAQIKEVRLRIVYDDAKKYTGFTLRFNPDIKHQYGILRWTDGDEYKGSFYNDLFCGYGRYLCNESGTTYEGQFRNNEMNGFGIEKWKMGSVFIGEYVNKEKNGLGMMRFDDHSTFEGEFKDNSINGYGTLTQSNKIVIQGYYASNQLDGCGIWEDKSKNRRYEGEMTTQGDWEGFGVLFDGDNTITIGKWSQSKINGEAIRILSNRKFEKCVYSKNKVIRVLQPDKITVYETVAEEILRGL